MGICGANLDISDKISPQFPETGPLSSARTDRSRIAWTKLGNVHRALCCSMHNPDAIRGMGSYRLKADRRKGGSSEQTELDSSNPNSPFQSNNR